MKIKLLTESALSVYPSRFYVWHVLFESRLTFVILQLGISSSVKVQGCFPLNTIN